MKWYVIKDNENSVDVLLDHNTTATVAWNSSGKNADGMKEVATALTTDTSSWASGLNPKLITANEIASITNTTTFDGSSDTWFYFNGSGDNKQTVYEGAQGSNPYAWLFDYTNECTSYGCQTADSSTSGYWTQSPVSNISSYAWSVGSSGSLDFGSLVVGNRYGVRPVITISKSVLES